MLLKVLSNKQHGRGAFKSYDFLFIYSYISVHSTGYVLKHLNFLAEELSKRGYFVGLKLIPMHFAKLILEEFKNGEISLNTFLRVLINSLFFLTGLRSYYQLWC
jgi:hypothetical protein